MDIGIKKLYLKMGYDIKAKINIVRFSKKP